MIDEREEIPGSTLRDERPYDTTDESDDKPPTRFPLLSDCANSYTVDRP